MSKVEKFRADLCVRPIMAVAATDYDTLATEADKLRARVAELEAGQEPYAFEYGKDNGDGSYSVTITRGAIPSYMTPVKDWPVKPLYTAPQPQQDVSGLVEALRTVRRSVQESGLRSSLKIIDAALAARDKKSGEVKP